jgi:hypothetical protein
LQSLMTGMTSKSKYSIALDNLKKN